MNGAGNKVGYFVFSLDTELAWGSLNWDLIKPVNFEQDGPTERATIQRLLDLLDEFGIAATWAITGHLFYEKCEECPVCPVLALEGKDQRFNQIWKSQGSIWYGADIVDKLLATGSRHEIAFHGYTHRLFDRLSRDEAELEIQEWLRLAKRKGIVPKSVVFPQGKVGHLDLFQEAGFITYRGKEVRHPFLSIPLLGKLLNRININLTYLTPQVYDIQPGSNGLINLASSQWMFRSNRKIEEILDNHGYYHLRFLATRAAIMKAASEKKIIHLWAHPHEFRTEMDFKKLRYVFSCFAEAAKGGQLKSITMVDLAEQVRRG